MQLCETCGKYFDPKARKYKPKRFCSRACYDAAGPLRGRPKERVKDQRMVRAPGHPIAPPSGMLAVARLVLFDKVGPGPHPCHWCGVEVDWKTGLVNGALIADHLNWDRNDDSPENLVPACLPCNTNRQREHQDRALQDDDLTMMWGGYRTRAVRRECEFCGSEFLTIPAEVKKGKGRFCSRECGYANRRKRAA